MMKDIFEILLEILKYAILIAIMGVSLFWYANWQTDGNLKCFLDKNPHMCAVLERMEKSK